MDRSMFCNNCGGKGHLFRTCKDPVLSCGILLVDSPSLPAEISTTRVLMIRRKDSMSFAEFMRGKYDVEDLQYIGKLFQNMTLKEQSLLVCEPFEPLWKHTWGDDKNMSEFIAAKEKFAALDKLSLMVTNLSSYTEPEWGFPKGRRMRGETDIACAAREFGEETNIPRDAYVVLKNMVLEETFVGLNGIQYKHIYFVAMLKHPEMVNLFQKFTPMQRREISGIGWKTFDEVLGLIRPHHTQRTCMVEQFKSILETFEAY